MNFSLSAEGFEIHRRVLNDTQVSALRTEADTAAAGAGSACVRHLRSRSKMFDELSYSPELMSLLPDGLRPVRSILFDKTPDENWPVLWHQDLTIAVKEEREIYGYGPWSHKDGSPHVQPPIALLANMVTIRIHLDETPASNGALQVIPRSHLKGKILHETVSQDDKDAAVTCECHPGDVLLMSPLILHSSRRSTEPLRRRVIHFEYARESDLDPKLQWFEPATTITF